MLGLERHFFLVKQRPQDQPVPDARRAEVASLMQTWAAQQDPPAGRSADAHAWIRRKAMEVLGAVGQVARLAHDGQALVDQRPGQVERQRSESARQPICDGWRVIVRIIGAPMEALTYSTEPTRTPATAARPHPIRGM